MNFVTKWKINSLRKKLTAMAKYRQHNQVSDDVLKKEIAMLYALAALYDKNKFNKNVPHAAELALESYRAAALLHDTRATYLVGNRLLEQGKYWDSLENTFLSSSIHKKYAEDIYKEAFTYLDAAESSGNPLAKRLKGLAYINGWGVVKDSDRGFKLVVESIDQEGSWDRATKLFEEMKLNRPEFFSSIMSAKQTRGGG